MGAERFLDYVRGECAKHHCKFDLLPIDRMADGCRGMFTQGAGRRRHRLTVCARDPDWLMVAAHELGHLHQFVAERKPAWWVYDNEHYADFESWAAGGIVAPAKLLRACRAAAHAELDAEHRALRMMVQFKLATAEERRHYTKDAALYVMSFEFARRHGREWAFNMPRAAREVPEILEAMEPRLPSGSHLHHLDPGIEALVLSKASEHL